MADAYFSNVSLLLPLDGSAAATTFRDYSNNHHVVTTAGNVISKPVGKYNGSAAYFDGTGDYLTAPVSATFACGTGEFTIEAWVYPTALPAVGVICDLRAGGAGSATGVSLNHYAGALHADTSTANATGGSITTGAWQHIAMTRVSNTLYMWKDGVQVGSIAFTNNLTDQNLTVGGYGGAYGFIGYIADLRITKGIARYTADFTAPTFPFRHALDPNVVLRLTGEDLFDYSQTAAVLTAFGSAAASATQFKYGAKSLYFDGSGDYVTITSNAAFAFGTGDFTVEFWAYPTRDSGNETILDMRASDTTIPLSIGKTGASVARCYDGTTVRTGGTFPINAWSHIAWVRSGTTNTIYIDGASAISFTNAFDKAAAAITLGSNVLTSAENYQGYIDDLTITRRAKYTATFARPAIQLPTETTADEYFSSVVLQLHMNGADTSTTFTDTSLTPKTVTAVNAQIRTTQNRFGGSAAYFDGAGDYLSLAAHADFVFGTGAFTIEAWIYPVANTNLIIGNSTTSEDTSWQLVVSAAGKLQFLTLVTSLATGATTITLNAWSHVAVSFDGVAYRVYLNGVMDGSGAVTKNMSTSADVRIGTNNSLSSYYSGYIDDLRITKGVARYV